MSRRQYWEEAADEYWEDRDPLGSLPTQPLEGEEDRDPLQVGSLPMLGGATVEVLEPLSKS